jgi:hypothetical protein
VKQPVVWSPRFLVVKTNGCTSVGWLSRVLLPEILGWRDDGTLIALSAERFGAFDSAV